MRRVLAFAAIAVTMFAACGREGHSGEVVNGAIASPGADSSTAPGTSAAAASATPETSASAAPSAAAGASAAPGTSSAPAAAAPAGKANPPKDGKYIYNINGKTTVPFAPPTYSGTKTVSSTHSGSDYTATTTNSEQPGSSTNKSRWTDTNVLLTAFKQESAQGTIECTLNPPLVITKFPIKPETFPTQQIKGSGNGCNGTLDVTVVKQEPMKDATGKSWNTWQAKVKLTTTANYQGRPIHVTQNDTRWVSPDLGTEIKSISHTDIDAGAQGKYTADETGVLKSHP